MKEFSLQKYRDISTILTDSFVYLRIHYKSLGKALLFIVLPFYLIAGALVGESYSGFISSLLQSPELLSDAMPGFRFMAGMLLLAFSSVALFAVTLKHVQLAQYTREITISDIMEDFGRHFFYLFALYVMLIFAIGFGLMFFIIPGIYIGIKAFLSPAITVIEDRNPLDAFGRSWKLTTGHWWSTFAVYLVMYIVTTFMSYVATVPVSILITFVSSSGADTSSVLSSGISLMYGFFIVIGSLFTVILIIASALHYFNLVERKEGRGLHEQIEELG
ncbi:hypothetical protein [Gracilimonas mengyeensis]|uniref:DUF7847 domain-containing protein n=1 Tax=Gracilimonas mengyeensis TaxID=1302730 RepID=A0A521FJE9_9BACT|nr:hypothetical protein [Gracilimonas mengyeensis]SMO96327.1 hypothetical protein SAMN06265219_12051 [Gracilimonas mengyeensis]